MCDEPLVIAVCGLPRSGSSCVAGLLQILGVPMGRSWLRPSRANPKGFFEDRGLNRIRRACGAHKIWSHPEIIDFGRTVELLKAWRTRRAKDGPIIGGKLPPFLARIIPEMDTAWPAALRVIVPERPIMDSARSASPGRFWRGRPPKEIYNLFAPVAEKQNADLCRLQIPTLRVQFADIMARPREVIDSLISFCCLATRKRAIARAMRFVDPRLNHHTTITQQRATP